jgi:CRISPR-associated protein Csb2
MIALGIRYLTGYATATNQPIEKAEWPVHPARVFMAMAASHFETGADAVERAALEWLETAGAPLMSVGEGMERVALQRRLAAEPIKTYVPVNDDHGGIAGRPRQEKAQRKVWLTCDTVFLMWDREVPTVIRGALDGLCGKVTRIGHSSSLVQMWVANGGEVPVPNWIPAVRGDEKIRVAVAGSMAELDTAFNEAGFRRFEELTAGLAAAKGKQKTILKERLVDEFPQGTVEYRRPEMAVWQAYAKPIEAQEEPYEEPFEGPFGNIVILTKKEGRNLGLEATLQFTGALRSAAIKAAGGSEGSPEWLSGHERDGSPSQQPHAAFFPLPFVGGERKYADGHLMGAGIAIPRGIGTEELRRVLGPLFFNGGAEQDITLYSHHWKWELERESRERPPIALRQTTWTGPSRNWASVTPVVLHHHPKKSREGDVERILREAFRSAKLPDPVAIRVQSASAIEGAGHARSMPEFDEGGERMCRFQTHVQVLFQIPVIGPVLVGRGRYRGYGFFRPTDDSQKGGSGA